MAVAQLGLALRESEGPVAELGTLFGRLSEALAVARTAPAISPAAELQAAAAANPTASTADDSRAEDPTPQTADAVSVTILRGLLEQLQTDVFKCIQQLQFHDRLVQHLTHVQDYLIEVGNELCSSRSQPRAPEFWDALHEKLRQRLISDEQRGLLELYLMRHTPARVSAQAATSDCASSGDLELF